MKEIFSMKIVTYLGFLVSDTTPSHFRSLRSNDFSSHIAVSFTQLPFGWARITRDYRSII